MPGDGDVTILTWNGTALQPVTTVNHGVPATANPMHTVGDIDNDGDADVVLFEPAGQYTVLRHSPGATWLVESAVCGGPATGLADLDGDGDLDGVCGGGPGPAYASSHSFFHIAINDNGTFRKAFTVLGLAAFRLAGAVDVDMDGTTDLIGGRTVWFNRGLPYEVEPQPDMPASLPMLVRPCDWDGDGDPDVVVDPSLVLTNDGSGKFSETPMPLPPAPPGTTFSSEHYRGDFDGDGDLDGIGPSGTMRGTDRALPFDGYRLQYGGATASAGGMQATLGATGPFVAGAPTELVVSGAPGNAALVLAIGAGPGPLANWPFPGMTAHVTQVITWFTSVAGGNIGEPGTGQWRLNVPMPTSVSGVTSHLQVWTWDPVSGAFGQTNGLELRWR